MNKLRKWLANKLAALARRIYPESDEVKKFKGDVLLDLMITGGSFVRVNPEDVYLRPADAVKFFMKFIHSLDREKETP